MSVAALGTEEPPMRALGTGLERVAGEVSEVVADAETEVRRGIPGDFVQPPGAPVPDLALREDPILGTVAERLSNRILQALSPEHTVGRARPQDASRVPAYACGGLSNPVDTGQDSHGSLERGHAERGLGERTIDRRREPTVPQEGPAGETLHAVRACRPVRDAEAPLFVTGWGASRHAISRETEAIVTARGDSRDEVPLEPARREHLPLAASGPVDPILSACGGGDRESPPVAEVGGERDPRPT